MLKNFTIKTRLIALLVLLCSQLVIGGVIGIGSLGHSNESLRKVYDERLVRLGTLDKIVRLIDENESSISKALTGEQSGLEQVLKSVSERNKTIDAELAKFVAENLTPTEKNLADSFAAHHKKYVVEGIKPALDALVVLDTMSAVAAVHGPMSELLVPVQDDINRMIQLQLDTAKADYEAATTTYQLVRTSCIAAILAALLIAIAVGARLVRTITGQLGLAVNVAEKVAGGDLGLEIKVVGKDETSKLLGALKHMNGGLVSIVGEVRSATETIASASVEIANGNADLSARTEHQASSLEETAASLTELTATVKQNTERARRANQLAVQASTVAHDGGDAVSQVVRTMDSIQAASRKIVDIIAVIDGIAFQTNILALNAAVEAARAGEQGRGFAVVASEVRGLAQRSAAAAKEIKELITDTVGKVDGGTQLVGNAGAKMDDVVHSIHQVAAIMDEIMSVSDEQASGIEQIGQAVREIDEMTQQNAALVEEVSTASANMRQHAAALAEVVSVFRLDTHAGEASTSQHLKLPAGINRKMIGA